VVTCPQCGRESPDEFGFCPACGAALGVVAPPREVRKVVTVLFCDLTGSTAIGERTDPEALRGLMNRYYDAARVVLERHGGTVEKFVGDAVMAVFGIPVASEDDALRATRAAAELRDVVHELGLDARIGVNTGAVVAGEGDTLVTGDAVNVAARLEQAAGAGEILLGDDTLRLVRDAVDVEPVELELKGKALAVRAHLLRALDASAAGVARRLERPMVGRERERDRLRADFADVVESRTCRLFTLIGPAGIGKSRLVADFLDEVDGAAELARGRALSYGEGITYWPLVEILIQLGIEPGDAIRSSPAETQLATRALFERRAEDGPLVLVVDDLQWAEPPMLDLVDHVADWARAAPILLVCVSRPELLDVRPQWAGGKLNATSILLEPLASAEVDELADALLQGLDLDPETRARILATAEGNPLFLEEMAALAREARGTVDVPPTIRALLQARLDTLDDDERAVIERGAIEGQVFHRGAVTALAMDRRALDVPGRLVALVRKELVRPDRSSIAGDDAFRFRHLLIRDAAYEALPKAVRAELHERFARWLEARNDLVEQDEIVGYHLEQASRYRLELDASDPEGVELARRAAELLGRAGRAALERGDLHATQNLMRRALALADGPAERRRLIPDLADALVETRTNGDEVVRLLDELATGDEHDRALEAALRIRSDPAGPLDVLLARLDVAQKVLTDAGDQVGLGRAECARAWVYWGACRMRDAHSAWRRAREHLRSAGSTILARDVVFGLCLSATFGGSDAETFGRLLDELEVEAASAGPAISASLRSFRARWSYGMGEGDAAGVRAAAEEEALLLEQVGVADIPSGTFERIVIPMLDGDLAEMEAGLRWRMGRTASTPLYHANSLAMWAVGLCMRGDSERALGVVEEARELADADDVADQIQLDLAEAYAHALAGDSERAWSLVERARERTRETDMEEPGLHHEFIEARILAVLADLDGARRLLAGLAERYARRGLQRYAERYRSELEALG
jgi:class 3 adenylate cyclase